jgi:putative hydrolase of the HAD superfamily
MKKDLPITTLFVDIGGVLLTDGWVQKYRSLAAKTFDLNFKEMEIRHYLNFNTYESGKLSIDEYLRRVVFYEGRRFSLNVFKKFMFSQSKPYPQMINLIAQLKAKYGLKIVVVSNEARELNAYRIHTFKLDVFVDSFISSCYVHLRKPDEDIFRLALDISQVNHKQIVYIDNTFLFVQVAESLGIKSIFHRDYKTTQAKLACLGLVLDK